MDMSKNKRRYLILTGCIICMLVINFHGMCVHAAIPEFTLSETDSQGERIAGTGGNDNVDTAEPSTEPVKDPDKDKEASTEPVKDPESASGVEFNIDNENLYPGMSKTYSEGYMPECADGRVNIVIPVTSTGNIKGDRINTAVQLGDTANSPFVYKNYRKDVTLKEWNINNSDKKNKVYLIEYELDLNKDRLNGTYPVDIKVSGFDEKGNKVEDTYTMYVVISDGKEPDTGGDGGDGAPADEPTTEITFAPKVLVKEYSTESIGENKLKASITIYNSSRSENVRNLTVSVSDTVEGLQLESPSDTVFVDKLNVGETYVVTYEYSYSKKLASGQYNLALSMDYADDKGTSFTSAGNARINIEQPLDVSFDPLDFPSEVEVGDKVTVSLNAINLGNAPVYNVRAQLEADGVKPAGTLFIGSIEAGAVGSGSVDVNIGGLSSGDLYGYTSGTITCYYEDSNGVEYSYEMEFETNIMSPFTQTSSDAEKPADTSQWWIIMVFVAAVFLILGGVIISKCIMHRRKAGDDLVGTDKLVVKDCDNEEISEENKTE